MHIVSACDNEEFIDIEYYDAYHFDIRVTNKLSLSYNNT